MASSASRFEAWSPESLVRPAERIHRGRQARFDVAHAATVVAGGACAPCTIRNVAPNGLMIETSAALVAGQIATIAAPGFDCCGQVRWVARGRAGIRAFAPIDLRPFDVWAGAAATSGNGDPACPTRAAIRQRGRSMLDLVRAITPRSWLSRTAAAVPRPSVDDAPEIVRIAALLEFGGRVIDCNIVELTSRSASVQLDALEAAHGAFIGQHGLLRPHHGRPVSTVVRWFTDRSLSLKFVTAVGLGAFSSSIDRFREGMQRAGRAQIEMKSQIIADAKGTTGTILNISCGGALIRTSEPFRPGEPIMLQPELLRPIGGYVRWRKERQMGVMFNRLLPVESAEIIAKTFAIHPVWLEEISECHRD